MEKLVVLDEKCIGCGLCVGQNPEYFEFNDEGLSKVKPEKELISSEEKKDILEVVEMCPTEAIVVMDEKNI